MRPALVHRKYHRLFSSSPRPKKPGPKGPSEPLIRAIVELKSRNPRFGCPRMARIISRTFGVDIDKNVVYRVLSKHYRPSPGGEGPSWRSFIGRLADSFRSVATFQYEPILLHGYWARVALYHCTRARKRLCWNARDRESELEVLYRPVISRRDETVAHGAWCCCHRSRGPEDSRSSVDPRTTGPRSVSIAHGLVEHAAEAGANDQAACRRAAFEGNGPFRVAVGSTRARAEPDAVRWASHCRGLVQLPMAA